MGFEKEQRPFLGERYLLGESLTQKRWVDGKPIFRRVVALTGGNGTSTVTVAALANVIDVLIRADVTVLEATQFEYNRASDNATATESGVEIIEATGAITAFHSAQDYSSDGPLVILEYTKQ